MIGGNRMQGKVYIIGAGPGNYKMMTIKALECIRKADVIVHDRLIDSKVLGFASKDAEIINVGKHPTYHQVPQKEINQIICKLAKEGKKVARVKGGDSFLFGRGGEECEYLREHGVNYEVVPGVTSSIAVPAFAGIPVTHRNFASSVHIITGHKSPENEGKSFDLEVLAKVEGTLVFLMGVKNIEEICTGLLKFGKEENTPVAIIEKGGSPDQRVIRGELNRIVEISEQEKVSSPAVIVIGYVAQLHDKLAWFNQGILSGKRIVVTRPTHQSQGLVDTLEELGATVIEYPVIKIESNADTELLLKVINQIQDYQWMVFTSANGVNIFFDQLKIWKKDIRHLQGLKFAVVGAVTQKALEERGVYADYVPDQFTTAHLCEGLLNRVESKDKLLLLRSEIASKELTNGLSKKGIAFDDVPVYNTIENKQEHSELPELINKNRIDYIIFTSPSTVHSFKSIFGEECTRNMSAECICIGPVTAKAVEESGMKIAGVADEYLEEGIVNKLLELS